MFIRDHAETMETSTPEELQRFLLRRFDADGARVNSFWLCHVEDYPALSILVREESACLDWMFDAEGTTFSSARPGSEQGEMGTTLFFFNGQPQPVLNYQIVTFDAAIRAAVDFLKNPTELSHALDWDEL